MHAQLNVVFLFTWICALGGLWMYSKLKSRLGPVELKPEYIKGTAVLLKLQLLLMYVFLADRKLLFFGSAARTYSRDLYLAVLAVVLIAAVLTHKSVKVNASTTVPVVLSSKNFIAREISEEWKGWMQVSQQYCIRTKHISTYFWLTGWGNGLYFYNGGDLSIKRLGKMLWRLNALVLGLMLVTGNGYILYYFVPMVTIFTLMIYLMFRIAPNVNKSFRWIMVKICVLFGLLYVMFDLNAFRIVARPFAYMISPGDPEKALHELHFRLYLDHYSAIAGLVFAVCMEPTVRAIEVLETKGKRYWLLGISLTVMSLFVYFILLQHNKFAYNALHPYFVLLPIICYILWRCWGPKMRSHYLYLFQYIGTISLELYVAQYHIWLADSARQILVIIPGYPFLNALLCTVIFWAWCHEFSRGTVFVWNAVLSDFDVLRIQLGLMFGSLITSIGVVLVLL